MTRRINRVDQWLATLVHWYKIFRFRLPRKFSASQPRPRHSSKDNDTHQRTKPERYPNICEDEITTKTTRDHHDEYRSRGIEAFTLHYSCYNWQYVCLATSFREMNLPLTSSSSPAQHKLEHALANFHCILTPEELSNLPVTSPDALSMVKLTAEIDAKGKNRTLRRCGSYFDLLLESIMLYSGVADTLVSSNPQIAALVWGSVKIVILVCVPFAPLPLSPFQSLNTHITRLRTISPGHLKR